MNERQLAALKSYIDNRIRQRAGRMNMTVDFTPLAAYEQMEREFDAIMLEPEDASQPLPDTREGEPQAKATEPK